MEQNDSINGFVCLGRWIKEKWCIGKLSPSLWAYLGVGVIICGCLGAWSELSIYLLACKNNEQHDFLNVIKALLASSWSIFGASGTDFLFSENKNFVRSIPIYVLLFLLLMTYLFRFCNLHISIRFFIAILSFLFATVLWFLNNAGKINDNINSEDPLGGNAHKELTGTNKENLNL